MIKPLSVLALVVTLVYAHAEMIAQDFVVRKYATRVERNVVYGTAIRFDGRTDTLRLNFFRPQADGNRRRPLIVWVHGGGFTGGSRSDFDVLAQACAERGYAAVTISYRLGFYPPTGLTNPYAYDSAEVVRAAYRASQDLFGAMRYMASRAASDSINPSFAIIGGASAGGITALQAAYIDETERYECTRALAPIPAVASPERLDLGPTTGTLHTSVATPRILAVVNLFGGIPDTSFINSVDDPALYQYHQTGDPVVACRYAKGLWSYPFGIPDNYYYIHGSCNIKSRVERLGFTSTRHRSWIFGGNVHGFHDPVAIDLDIATFLAPLVLDAATSVEATDDGSAVVMYSDRVCIADLTGRVVFEGQLPEGQLRAGQLPEGKAFHTLPNGAYVMRMGVETRLFMVLR